MIFKVFLKEIDRWPLWCPVALGLGIFIYFNLPLEPSLFFTLSICSIIWLTSLCIIKSKVTENFIKTTNTLFLLCIISFICLGFAIAKLRVVSLNIEILQTPQKNVTVEGHVTQILNKNDNYELKRVSIKLSPNSLFHQIGGIRFNLKNTQMNHIQIGTFLRCKCDLIPISQLSTPHGFNLRKHYFFQGIGAFSKIHSCIEIPLKSKPLIADNWRFFLTQQILKQLPNTTGSIAAALVTGDQSYIPSNIRQNYADSGIAHILAISGLHISLVAAIIFLVLRRCLSCISYLNHHFFLKRWAAVASIPITAIYVLISGMGFPAVRALIMTTIFLIGVILNRPALSMRSVSIAAMAILLVFPESIMSASFQLSFAAVIALIAFYESKWDILKQWALNQKIGSKFILYTLGIVSTTIIATIATTPFTIAIFQRFTTQALLGNLIGIPLTTLWIMPAALISVILFVFGAKVSFFFNLWGLGIDFLTRYAAFIADFPGAAITIQSPHPLFIFFITIGGLWLLLWRGKHRFIGIFIMILGFFALFYDHHPHVFSAENGRTIAFRENNTLWVSNFHRGKFYYEQWAKILNIKNIKPWPKRSVQIENILIHADQYNKPDLSNKKIQYVISAQTNLNLKNIKLLDASKSNCFGWFGKNNQFSWQCVNQASNRPWN